MQGISLLYGVWQCPEIAPFCRRSVPKRLTGFCAGTAYYLTDPGPIGTPHHLSTRKPLSHAAMMGAGSTMVGAITVTAVLTNGCSVWYWTPSVYYPAPPDDSPDFFTEGLGT